MSADAKGRKALDYSAMDMSLIEFKIWDVTGQSVIQANVVYDAHILPVRRNIGAALLGRSILTAAEPLPRIVYELGTEIKLNWRELSTPKE